MRRLAPTVLCLLLALTAARHPAPAAATEDEVEAAVATLERLARDPFAQKERADAIRRLGAIGGREAVVALTSLFDDPFVHLHDRVISAWIRALGGSRAEESRRALADTAVSHRSAHVRRGAAVALGVAGGSDARPILEARLAREGDAEVQEALVEALLATGPPGAAVTTTLLRRGEGPALLALADALAASDAADANLAAFLEQDLPRRGDPLRRAADVAFAAAAGRLSYETLPARLADEAEEARIVLAEVLGSRPDLAPLRDDGLAGLLGDASWRVRAAAIAACRRHRLVDAAPLLIERLEHERGRLRLDALLALQEIAGRTIADDPELWRAWWAEHGHAPGPSVAEDPAGGPAPIALSDTRSFFRIPIRSKRLAFLIDCSGSMRDPAVPGRADELSKFDLARRELERTLAALDPETSFDVFLYRYPSTYPPKPRLTRALGRLRPATKATVRKATRWLADEEPKGWGAFYDALAALAAEEEVDTVYFLTDGRPSRGTYDRPHRLLEAFGRLNRFRRLVVHTVLVGRERTDRAFLRDLAAATGGLFEDATTGG